MKTLILTQLRTYLTLLFFCTLLLFLDRLNWLNFPKGLIQTVTVPIQYGLFQTGKAVESQFGFVFTARFASQENKALKQQLGTLLSENANLRTRLAQAQAQVDQQNSLSPKTFNLVPARPIGLGRYLLIDKGSSDGVKINEPVVFKDNFIGLIKEVSAKSAQVLLEQDPDSKIAAFSQSQQGRSKGILQGQFGSEALMDKILHSEQISQGDLVYSEGTEGILPRGLVLGSVTQVLERQNEVFKQAKVKPVFDISDLEVVFIIKS